MTNLKIVVLVKQVPSSSDVEMDVETGNLIRDNFGKKINPYDLYAIETALCLKESIGGKVIAITMGPSFAKDVLIDCFSLGVDEGYLVSGKGFSGADVLATSKALSEAIKLIGDVDIIICGRQTTDGDTAQVGASVAAWLSYPWLSWVNKIEFQDDKISANFDTSNGTCDCKIKMPCVISVNMKIGTPRLPTLKSKLQSKYKTFTTIQIKDLFDSDENKYGIKGSATKVKKVYLPKIKDKAVIIDGNLDEKVAKIFELLN